MATSTDAPNYRLNSRLLPMSPGMYIFRFATQLAGSQKVFISLQSTPLNGATTDFFASSDVKNNTLTKLGDCIIARVHGGVAGVLITQYGPAGQPAVPVDLRVDRIETGPAIIRSVAAPVTKTAAATPAAKVPAKAKAKAKARRS